MFILPWISIEANIGLGLDNMLHFSRPHCLSDVVWQGLFVFLGYRVKAARQGAPAPGILLKKSNKCTTL